MESSTDGPIPVEGTIEPVVDMVYVDGYQISVNEDGSFSTTVDFTGNKDYEIVEVIVPETELRERILFFRKSSNGYRREGWQVGSYCRIRLIGTTLRELIDASGWIEQIGNELLLLMKEIGDSPQLVCCRTNSCALAPARSGVAIDFTLTISAEYELWWNTAVSSGSSTIIIQIEQIGIGASADGFWKNGTSSLII